MIRERLRIISLHEGVRWALFLGAVGLYGLLLLAEASNKRLAGLGLSEFWAVMFVFGGWATFLLILSIASTQDFAALHARTPD